MLEPATAELTTITSNGQELLVPPPKQKRSSVACRRCRRLRAKCIKDEEKGLCRGCIEAGVPNECQFLPRGMSAIDRAPRPPQNRKRQARPREPSDSHPEPSGSGSVGPVLCEKCSSPSDTTNRSLLPPSDGTNKSILLPPHDELVEACEWFFTTYFQLGFLHKPTFMHKLRATPDSLSTFLLLSMLSVSARFAPSLISRYHSPAEAAEVFARSAHTLIGEEMLAPPTIERTQAFFLCSIWNWGSGYRDRSWIFLGIAARMASILRLSQEETYGLRADSPVEDIINAEMSRRTWWVIFMSDNLLSSGWGRPVSFDLEKVTIPLPCDEDHFTFGFNGPATVLEGTNARPRLAPVSRFPNASIDPQLGGGVIETDPAPAGRSLYGNLITITDIWARVARGAIDRSKPTAGTKSPWSPDSEYNSLLRELQAWEASLTGPQTWSLSNLLAYQSKSLDLGYRCIFLIFHLSHIVLRRSYLPMMARDVHSSTTTGFRADAPPPRYWEGLVHEMFSHALRIIELVKSWFPTMPFARGSTPMMGFAIYMAGSVLSYLKRWEWLCPALADYSGPAIIDALALLTELAIVWPTMARRWHRSLSRSIISVPPQGEQAHKQVEGFGNAAEQDLDMDDREGLYRQKNMDVDGEREDREDAMGVNMLYSLAAAASTHRVPASTPYPPNVNAEGTTQADWNKYHDEIGNLFKGDDFSNQMEYAADGWNI